MFIHTLPYHADNFDQLVNEHILIVMSVTVKTARRVKDRIEVEGGEVFQAKKVSQIET